jgi:hypothetical protein
MTKLSLRILTGAFCAFLLSVPVYAEIDGSIWENQNGPAADATVANLPTGPADVTFSLPGPSIDFNSGAEADGYTIFGFLNSGGATITGGTFGAADGTNTMDNTIFNITGTVSVTSGESFTTGHDDGLTFIIDGQTIIDAPGPTAFSTTSGTFTGTDGTYDFQIVYGETQGPPAVLEVSGLDLTSTPEPSSMVLMSSVLLGLGFTLRKRFAK